MAPGHEIVHLVHRQGGNQVDAGVSVQIGVGGLLHHRGQMDGVDHLHVGECVRQPPQGGHDLGHGLAVVLPAVAGDQDHFLPQVVQLVQDALGEEKFLLNRSMQRVDHRVSGDEQVFAVVLPLQIGFIGPGGAEIQLRQTGD